MCASWRGKLCEFMSSLPNTQKVRFIRPTFKLLSLHSHGLTVTVFDVLLTMIEKNKAIREWCLQNRKLNHWSFPFSRCIVLPEPWEGHFTGWYLFGWKSSREESCNFVCQTPTGSSMESCWLHFRLQFRPKNTSGRQKRPYNMPPRSMEVSEWKVKVTWAGDGRS